MNYVVSIAIISVLWGGAEVLRKMSAGGSDSRLLSTTFNFGAFIAPLIWLLIVLAKKETIAIEQKSVILSVVSGALVGLGCVALFGVLSKNVSTSVTLGLVHTLTILVLIAGSVLFLSDHLTPKLVIGLVMSMIGVFLLTSK